MCCHDAKNSSYFCPRGPECDFCKDAREVELSPTLELGSTWGSDDEPTPPTIPTENALVDTSRGSADWDESWNSWWDELVSTAATPKENSQDSSEVSTSTKGDALGSGCSTGWDESWDSWWEELVSAAATPKVSCEVSTSTKADALGSRCSTGWDESWDSWWDELVSAATTPKDNSQDNSEVSTSTTPKGDAHDNSGCSTDWDESWDSWWEDVVSDPELRSFWEEHGLPSKDHEKGLVAVDPPAVEDLPQDIFSLAIFCREQGWRSSHQIAGFLNKMDDAYILSMIEEGKTSPEVKELLSFHNGLENFEWDFECDKLEHLVEVVRQLGEIDEDPGDENHESLAPKEDLSESSLLHQPSGGTMETGDKTEKDARKC